MRRAPRGSHPLARVMRRTHTTASIGRMPTEIRPEPPRQPEVEELLRLSDEFAFALYPADSCYLLDVGELEKPGVTVFLARTDGRALGMAALVVDQDAPRAELKRMFVHPDARGQGLARGLLSG